MSFGVPTPLAFSAAFLAFAVGLGLAGVAFADRKRLARGAVPLALGGLLLAAAGIIEGGEILETGAGALAAIRAASLAAVLVALFACSGIRRNRLLLAGAVVLLSIGEPMRSGHAASHVAADGLAVAGLVALGAFTLRQARRTLAARFIAGFLAVLLLAISMLSGVLTQIVSARIERDQLERLAAVASAERSAINALEAGLTLGPPRAIAANSSFAAQIADSTVAKGSARSLLDALFSSADVSFLVILNRKGQVLDAAGLPDVDALGIAGSVSAQSVLASGNPVATLDVAGPSRLAYLGFTPAIDPRVPDRLAGVVVVGRFLDSTYLSAVSNATGFQASLLRGGEVSGSTLASGRQRYLNDPDVRSLLESAAEDGRQVTAHTGGAGGLISAYIPLLQGQGSSQRTLGFLTLSTGASVVGTAAAEVVRALFLVSAAAALVAAALAAAGGRRIARPVRALTGAAERVRGGDLLARASVSGEDEVATLARAFNDMASSVEGLTHSLRDAAATDARLRARLEAVLFGMGDALAVTDGDGVVQVFNRAAETLTGSSAVQAIGRPLGEAVRGPEGHGHSLAAAAGSPLARGTRTFRGAILRAGGDVVEVAVSAAPVPGPGGEILGRVVVMRDVTREVEVERMKSEFLSNISHELRTPLTPIKGYAELLRRKDFPRKRQEVFLDNMIEAANKLERIVQILVDFSAFEAGRLEVKREPVPVRLLLDDTVARWRERIQTHTIVRRARADLPAVAGDPRMLERVLDELVDNAVKFSPDGGTITLSAEAVKWRTGSGRAHRGVRLSVRDHGVGISPDHLPRLFEEFRQADGSETREFGGLGLGLAFVRRIGDALGGNIEVESTPGKGSVFHFTLPEAVLRGRSARGEAT